MFKTSRDSTLNISSVLAILFYLSYGGYLLWHYTFFQGLFFTFLLLTFLGLGLAGLFRLPSLALSTLAIAAPQLIVWLIDSVWFNFFKASLFGLAEARFHPGLSKAEFLFSYYPLLLILLSFLIIRRLPRPSKTPYLLTSLLSIGGLLISRFVFTAIADPNCSRLVCIEFFDKISLSSYPWIFLLLYTGTSLVLLKLLSIYFELSNKQTPFNRFPRTTLILYFLFSLTLMISDLKRFNSNPRFNCQTLPPIKDVHTQCGYTLNYSPGFFSLFFNILNKSSSPKHCNFYLIYKDTKETMYGGILIKEKEGLTSSIVLPYPTDPNGSSVSLTSECINAN